MSFTVSSPSYYESANKFYETSKAKKLFCTEQNQLEEAQIIAIATYIEQNLSKWSAAKTDFRVGKEQTGLARTILYQASSKKAYIKLSCSSVKGTMVMYDPENPLNKESRDASKRS